LPPEPALIASLIERIYELHLEGKYDRIVPLIIMLDNMNGEYYISNAEEQFLGLIRSRI
jgi:hypothetical protein